ncbi:MAG: hypothetical protein WD135_05180 [Ferruginibacter sp.]
MVAIKNMQFTHLYKVNGYLKEFNFRKSNSSNEGKVSVDTIDDRGNRIIFFLEKYDTGWKVVTTDLPIWVFEQESQLHEAIVEGLAAK